MRITPETPLGEILNTYPELNAVFLAYRMNCLGCYLASFDTLADALHAHDLPVAQVVEALNARLEGETGE